MNHTFFALFDDPRNAAGAVSELEKIGANPQEHCSIIVHQAGLHANDLDIEETGFREGLMQGAGLGAGLSALLAGLAAGPLGLVGAGWLATTLFAAGAGTLYGGLAAALAGAGSPDPALERLATGLADGQTLVTVKAPDIVTEETAERIFREHGAKVVEKPILGVVS